MSVSPSHHANGNERSRRHPLTPHLIRNHNQDSWAIANDADGSPLFCAPVGFYRVMKLCDNMQVGEGHKTPDGTKTLVFGFRPEDLDLEPHPEYPGFRILKNTAYILPPVPADFIQGWAENEMRRHQGQWLDFALGYSNLYHTSKNGDHFLTNNFAAYRIYPNYDEDGDVVDYNVTYRINPFSRFYGYGMDQDKDLTPRDQLMRGGISLKRNIGSLEEAETFVHRDFRDRYMSFLKSEEVQRWTDPHRVQGAAMWLKNRMTDMRGHPVSLGSAALKIAELVFSKLKLSSLIISWWSDTLDENANKETQHNDLDDIAEVAEDALVPLNTMKNRTRRHCIAVENPEMSELLNHPLPSCPDLVSHHRVRALDLFHGMEPALIYIENGGDAATARSRYGLAVHRIGNGKQRYHVTYAPGSAFAPIPERFTALFKQDSIAEITLLAANQNDPQTEEQKVQPQPFGHKIHLGFRPQTEVAIETKDYAYISRSVKEHKHPDFGALASVVDTSASIKKKHGAFRHCAKTLCYYGRFLSPLVDGKAPAACRTSLAALTVAVALHEHQGWHQIYENLEPWAFAISGALMARRLGANARSETAQQNLNIAAQGMLTAGPLAFGFAQGHQLVGHFSEHASEALSLEFAETAASISGALYAAGTYFRRTRSAIAQRLAHDVPSVGTLDLE